MAGPATSKTAPTERCMICRDFAISVGTCGGDDCQARVCHNCVVRGKRHCDVRVPYRIEHPTPSMPVTKIVGTDCYPYMVVEVCTPRKIALRAVIVTHNGLKPLQYAPIEYATLRGDGAWRQMGDTFIRYTLGTAGERRDPAF